MVLIITIPCEGPRDNLPDVLKDGVSIVGTVLQEGAFQAFNVETAFTAKTFLPLILTGIDQVLTYSMDAFTRTGVFIKILVLYISCILYVSMKAI